MVTEAGPAVARPRATLIVVSAAAFLASLDLFIVNIAFPAIRNVGSRPRLTQTPNRRECALRKGVRQGIRRLGIQQRRTCVSCKKLLRKS